MADAGRPGFDAIYQAGTAPWDIGRPQPDFAGLAEAGLLKGRVLDAGCGTGEHALLAAGPGLSLSLDATGIDSAPTAIASARAKAEARGVAVRFLVWDALELPALGEQFDTVLDCGLFHVFDDDDRARFVASLAGAVAPGGRYYMLCFSEQQPGDWGPRRVTQDEIRASFSADAGWQVDSIEPGRLYVTFIDEPIRAWLSSITRV
jgi:SAM-dependent methyltransferase